MSVRIYQLSKELNMTNKEILAILQARGLDVTSPSSSIANIYADSFREEFKKKPEKIETLEAPETPAPTQPSPPPSPRSKSKICQNRRRH